MSKIVKLTAGDEVYLEDGRVAEFVTQAPDGFIVRPIIEGDEGGWSGKPILVTRISREEPVDKTSPAIAELRAAEADLRLRVSNLRTEARDLEQSERDRRARIAQHGLLETLDDFLAGRITHAMTREYDDKFFVRDLVEAAKDESSYSTLRLISLKGQQSGKTTSWSIEGQGGFFVPTTSREAAIAVAAAQIAKRFDEIRKNKSGNPINLVASCQRLGLPVPDDMAAIVDATAQSVAVEAVRKAEQHLQVARAQLAALAPKVPA